MKVVISFVVFSVVVESIVIYIINVYGECQIDGYFFYFFWWARTWITSFTCSLIELEVRLVVFTVKTTLNVQKFQ